MVKPAEPKFYPLVSDSMFEGKVKGSLPKRSKGATSPRPKMSKRTKNESAVEADLARAKLLQRTIDHNEELAGRTVGKPAGNTSGEPAGGTKEESVGSAVAANARKNLSSEEIENINNKAAKWRGSLGPVGGTKPEPTTTKPIRRTRAQAEKLS